MTNLLGDWNFLQSWWWKPYIKPLIGLAWFAGVIALGAIIFFAVMGSARLSEYREALFPPKEPEIPEDEAELIDFMESYFPEASEEEIILMEQILDDVMKEDIHPQMAREIEARGIPVRLLTLPPPEIVRAVGNYPVAVWIPQLNAIEIYASVVKSECRRDPKRYREKIGDLLLHEIGHALGLDEPKIKDFGV